MSGVLALVGGAEFTPGCDFDAALLEAAGTTQVVVIPTAAAYEGPDLLAQRASEWFSSLGAGVHTLDVFRRADALQPEPAKVVADARFVYLTSGSPMHLRSVLKDTPLWDAIVSAWHGGAVLAASAEAAAVLSSHMVDQRGGAFTVGLNLLTTLTVIPRFDQWSPEKAHRTAALAPAGLAVVGIHDRTALLHHPDGRWEASGSGAVEVHLDGRPARVEDLIPLP